MAGHQLNGMEKILIALFASPIVGFIFGYILLQNYIFIMLERHTRQHFFFFLKRPDIYRPRAGTPVRAQRCAKDDGDHHLALVAGGYLKVFAVPLWVIVI